MVYRKQTWIHTNLTIGREIYCLMFNRLVNLCRYRREVFEKKWFYTMHHICQRAQKSDKYEQSHMRSMLTLDVDHVLSLFTKFHCNPWKIVDLVCSTHFMTLTKPTNKSTINDSNVISPTHFICRHNKPQSYEQCCLSNGQIWRIVYDQVDLLCDVSFECLLRQNWSTGSSTASRFTLRNTELRHG